MKSRYASIWRVRLTTAVSAAIVLAWVLGIVLSVSIIFTELSRQLSN